MRYSDAQLFIKDFTSLSKRNSSSYALIRLRCTNCWQGYILLVSFDICTVKLWFFLMVFQHGWVFYHVLEYIYESKIDISPFRAYIYEKDKFLGVPVGVYGIGQSPSRTFISANMSKQALRFCSTNYVPSLEEGRSQLVTFTMYLSNRMTLNFTERFRINLQILHQSFCYYEFLYC